MQRATIRSGGLGVSALGLAGYAAVHPLPGTGALRTLCLLLILIGLCAHLWPLRPTLRWPEWDATGVALVTLTVWMAVQSAFFSVDGDGPLRTFAGEWPKILILAALGVGLARTAVRAHWAERMLAAVFSGYFLHVVIVVGYQAWQLASQGKFDFGGAIRTSTYNYGYISPLVEAALGIGLADAAGRLCRGSRLLPVSAAGLAVVLLLAFLALILLQAKASVLGLFVMLGLFCLAVAVHGSRWRKAILVGSLAALMLLTALGVVVENRWKGALYSIRLGAQIETHQAWLGTGEPLPAGADESFYLRSAWAVVAWRGLLEHPLGRGYGSDAFGRLVAENYGSKGGISSHNGWLDFALANGIPGLILLLAVGGALCRQSWRAFRSGTGFGGLALCFCTAGYFLRCSIEGHFTTSRLMGFALVAGLLWGLTASRDAQHTTRDKCALICTSE